MHSKKTGRRRFLQGSAAMVGMAVAGAKTAASQEPVPQGPILPRDVRPLSERSPFEKIYRTGTATAGLTPLQNSHGIITPSALHFYVNHEFGAIPVIDPEQHRLIVHGLVERAVILTMEEIRRLPAVSRVYFIECGGNGNLARTKAATTVQETHGRAACTQWTGVPLSLLLREVGVQPEGTWVIAGSADVSNHSISLPMEKCMDDILVVYGQNGEALRLDQGYPLRLIVPGWTGRIHVKWLNQLKVTHEPYMTTQEDFPPGDELPFSMTEEGRRRQYETYAKSVITFPSGGQRLPGRGRYEVSGLAWSGAGKISRVEVSTDDGRTWRDAVLQDPVLPKAFTRFVMAWEWDGRETVLQSRATDEFGKVQPSMQAMEDMWSSNEPCTELTADACSRIPPRANRALIQRWGVAADGSVSNLFDPTPGILEIG